MAKQIVLEDVIEKLDNGATKASIQAEYELTKSDIDRLWKHPSLKNRRGRKASGFELVDRSGEVIKLPNKSTTNVAEPQEPISEDNGLGSPVDNSPEEVIDGPSGDGFTSWK